MATIELKLSSKEQEGTGRREVLIRFFHGRNNMRAKSEVFVHPDFFEYYIDRKKTEKFGVRVPDNLVTTTKAKAAKAGFMLRDSGEIVMRQRILTPAVRFHKQQAERIAEIKRHIDEAFEAADKEKVAGDWLKGVVDRFLHPEKYTKKQERKKTLFELGVEYVAHNDFSEAYGRSVMVLLRGVVRYEGFIRETGDRAFTFDADTVGRDTVEDFFDYMANERQLAREHPKIFKRIVRNYPDGQNARTRAVFSTRSANYIVGMKKKMRSLFVWLRKEGYTDNHPMEDVEIGAERYGTPYYITIGERNTIADCDLTAFPSLEVQRDIFIFQCFVGCRVSDLMRLTLDNIDGGFLSYAPHKTKDEGEQTLVARVPLHPKAVALVERYKGADARGRLFPFIAPQKYNAAIKRIFTAAGITRNVVRRNPNTGENETVPLNEVASSHLARRTFVGNAYFKVSDPSIIGRMSGHAEGSKAFARYRNIEDVTLLDVINQLG